MPPADDHLAQAHANLAILRHLLEHAQELGPGASQWAVTIAFYTALHCVDAHLSRAGLPARGHKDRAIKLAQTSVPVEVVESYKQLQQWSEQARYLLATFELESVQNQVLTELKAVLEFVALTY